MTKEQKAALLRLIDFELEKIEKADDVALVVLITAIDRLTERDPIRIAKIIAVVDSLLEAS